MTIPLAYILHSGQLFGTERMALATLSAMKDRFEGVIIAPPGPVHGAAHAAGLTSRVAAGRVALLGALWRHLLQHRDSALLTTGVWHALAGRALQRLCGGLGAHLHVVHGGTDERLSYGRKRLLNRLDVRFVAVSMFVKLRLLAHGVPADRIEVISNFLAAPPASTRPRYAVGGLRRVVMLSRLDRIKRVGLLFDALERTPGLEHVRFDIYGSGEEDTVLRQRAVRHPNVTLHGFRADAAHELGRADLLMHTCPEEPFGVVLLESFAAGIAVLVPNSGGAGDIVCDGVNGWHFTANNAVALGLRLLELSRASAAQLNAMADGGRRSLQEDYACAGLVQRYARLAGAAA